MAQVIYTDGQKTKVFCKNTSLDTAKIIAKHMNDANKFAAAKTGQVIKFIYRAIG